MSSTNADVDVRVEEVTTTAARPTVTAAAADVDAVVPAEGVSAAPTSPEQFTAA
jgi:hypothetical protein